MYADTKIVTNLLKVAQLKYIYYNCQLKIKFFGNLYLVFGKLKLLFSLFLKH